ncbi:MAG: molecular chaperone DnaK [Microcystaceae cyanobacterium]
MAKVVGIDLGTTNSVVAVMEGGKPVVIANSEGMRTTPSVVGFNKDGELVVGQMARRQSVLNPQNTFAGVKRFLGRRYNELSAESKKVPYTIRREEDDSIKVRCPRLKKDFAPEEISAMILRKLADEASRYLGEKVTGAVITVPAYFNDSQRQATRDAGRIAGLEVLRIINEPTAASLAYGLEQRFSKKLLVFDLGGGTFVVSVLEVGDGVFEVKATSGDTQLGGNDFDKRIVNWLAEQFIASSKVDLREDRQALQRLTEAAEKAKIELSGVSVTDINLPFITATEDGPEHLETRLTRSQFEDLCGDLVTRLQRPVKRVLKDAGLSPVQIDEVVLVGGGTRMPMIKGLVRSFIDREPNENVNPDEVVAVGAAIQAGILGGQVKDILLLDVTPLSLGLETIGGVMKKLLPRNTTIPVRKSDIFSTGENNQTVVEIHALQGEREMATDNKSLGRFKLSGIPPAPRGIPQVQVSFDIDANGILQVTARDKTTGREQSITVQGSSTLSDSEVNRMIQEADSFAAEDRERRERIEKRNNAKALTDQAQRRLKEATLDFGSAFTSSYRRQVDALSAEILDSLEKDDERRLDRTQADLQDVLYELNREVRLQYDEEDEGFFSAIRKTFTGDGDDDDYGTRRSDYRDDYGREPRGSNGDRGVSYRMPRNPERGRGSSDGYDNWEETRPQRDRRPASDTARNDSRDYQGSNGSEDYEYRATASSSPGSGPRRRPAAPSKSNGSRYEERPPARGDRNQPINNSWDEDDDDDWF